YPEAGDTFDTVARRDLAASAAAAAAVTPVETATYKDARASVDTVAAGEAQCYGAAGAMSCAGTASLHVSETSRAFAPPEVRLAAEVAEGVVVDARGRRRGAAAAAAAPVLLLC
ncbi:hypothetical protein HK405_001108, partial [Cladochytrium tenue]